LQLEFIEKAFLAGSGIALIVGPLGSVIVWRRMTNFGDALGHATLLGVCFAWLFNINLYVGLISVSLIVAGILATLSRQKRLASDTLLTVLAQATLSLGLVLATFLEGVRMDLLGYLYGDILAVNSTDLVWILAIDCIGLVALVFLWRSLLSITIHEDIAHVEGVSVMLVKWSLILLLAIVFAIAMKLVGVLLITALLVIPASTARQFSKTPEQMAALASVFGVLSVGMGIALSKWYDWPAGPAIVISGFSLFIGSLLASRLVLRNSN
jgi:zinc transport system permease protein